MNEARRLKKEAVRMEQYNRFHSENYVPNKPKKQLTTGWRFLDCYWVFKEFPDGFKQYYSNSVKSLRRMFYVKG